LANDKCCALPKPEEIELAVRDAVKPARLVNARA
jgi:hypothetical protein